MRHHAIVVSSCLDELLLAAHKAAHQTFAIKGGSLVSPVVKSKMNGYQSFFVAPDGSKEGWADSDSGDAARERFKAYLRSKAYEDGSTSLSWVEVQFADDDNVSLVVDHDGADRPAPHDSKTCDEEDCYACRKERCDDMSAAMDCWNPYA